MQRNIVNSVFCLLGLLVFASTKTLVEEVNLWTNALGKELYDFTENVTGFKEIQKSFEGKFNTIPLNGTDISLKFANSLSSLLQSKSKALMAIKNEVERSEKAYKDDPNIAKFYYRNVHDVPKDNTTLVIKESFSTTVKINTTYSFVQVPTNVYKYGSSVLNAAKWSESLDKVYTKNYADDPALLWQYFGNAANGALRTYPGKEWSRPAMKDFYDSRKRGWYIQASSSPKDLVIVIDGSGTMIGNNFGIARVATMFLIDTLQENDFFNVIFFNVAVKFPIKCPTDGLLQATKENKEKMKAVIDVSLKPEKTGNVVLAMETALKLLKSVRGKPRSSSGCNQAIAFFSDGVEGDYAGKTSFERYNIDKHVRVFSYLVGRKKDAPKNAMVKMACENRGFFYKIETVGNIWDNALKYLSVLSRPLALTSQANVPIYTPLYLDASGLGMMMTVAIAAFKNATKPEEAVLLGVVGTDIAVSTLESRIPYDKVGVNGYGFAINNNGFLLFHPKLRGQAGYLPSPPNVYLEDLELNMDNKSVELKHAMIDGETGHKVFNLNAISKNGKRFTKIPMNYFYSMTQPTPFSTCVAIPAYGLKKLQAKSLSAQQKADGLNALKSTGNVMSFVAPWPYCNITAAAQAKQELSKKAYATAEEIRAHVEKNEYQKCEVSLVKDLLLSAATVSGAVSKVWNEAENKKRDVESVFVGTSSGYSRTLYSGSAAPISRNIFNEEFYEHAVNYVNTKNAAAAVFSVPIKTADTTPFISAKQPGNKSEPHITVSIPLRLPSGIFASVQGMKVKSSKLKRMFLNLTKSQQPNLPSCTNNATVDCYLVDENGYIVVTNGLEDEVGNFLGDVQGKLMSHLSKNTTNIFKRHTFKDTQAECTKATASSSDAMKLLTPFFTLSGYVVWWTQTLLSLLAQFSIYSSFSSSNQVMANTNISCVKQLPFYVVQETNLPKKGSVDCSKSCQHEYVVSKVNKTNLALIVVYKNCGKSCKVPKVTTTAVKIPDQKTCTSESRYRQLLVGCHRYSQQEAKKCGSAATMKPTLIMISLVSLASLLFF